MSDTFQEQMQKQHRARMVLYGLLALFTTVPLFYPQEVPAQPTAPVMDLYATLKALPDGCTVLVESDWTNSTRGESGGQFEALMRILMRKNIKFAIYAAADPQAPQVARDAITRINEERKLVGLPRYNKWTDWVEVGFFPNLEGTANVMATDLRAAWNGKKDMNEQGRFEDVFNSPVLKNVHSVGDVQLLMNITGSNTINTLIERLFGKVPLASMCTGVMGPETLVYYQSGQLKGVSVGLKGVYDIETCMQYGINVPDQKGVIHAPSPKIDAQIPGFPGATNYDRGLKYYFSLNVALALLIVAVVAGNVQMVLARRKEAKQS